MWRAIVIEGSADAVRAFVDAWVPPSGSDGESVVLGADVGLAAPAEQGRHTLLARGDVVASLRAALPGALRVTAERAIERARMDFVAEAASRAAAASVRAVTGTLHGGVRLEQHAEHEEEQMHDVQDGERRHAVRRYAYRASGTLAGSVADILVVRRRLAGTGVARPGALHVD